MMPWIKRDVEDYLVYEELVRDDDGAILGVIMRFYEDEPTYAWTTAAGRIGPISGPAYGDGTVFANEFYLGSEGDACARKCVEALAGKPEIPRPHHRPARPPRCIGYNEY